jgi:citrate lyase subunit beta/citryl-CoA lyase
MTEAINSHRIIRRSKLVVRPNDRAVSEFALSSGADAVVVDLIHGISGLSGDDFRRKAATLLKRLSGQGMDLLVWTSVNSAMDDLASCVVSGIDGALVTGDTEDDVWIVDRALTSQEINLGLPLGSLQIEVIVSSPRSVLDLLTIVKASPRITCLNLDITTLSRWMGVEESSQIDQFLYARGVALTAARLHGIEAHTLAFVPVESGEIASLDARARMASKMGYRGSLCWKVEDVPILNNAFGPSEEEVEYAHDVKRVMEEAIRQGKGAATLRSGTLVDLAMLRHSDAILSWADAIENRERMKKGRA